MTEFTGYLLYWDHDPRRDRLLIAFSDMDLNDPVWLPAAHVNFRLAPGQGRFGWGVFSVPPQLAERRQQFLARELRDRARDAALAAARPTRRPKIFRPKKKAEPPPMPGSPGLPGL